MIFQGASQGENKYVELKSVIISAYMQHIRRKQTYFDDRNETYMS